MRIAYLCVDPGIPIFGTKGASIHIQEVVREFLARGHSVDVLAVRIGGKGGGKVTSQGIDAAPEDLTNHPGLHVVEYPIREREPAARETAQAEVARAMAANVSAGDYDLIYERYSLFSTALADACAARPTPSVLEVNAPLIEEQRTHRVLVDQAGAQRALHRQAQAATAVICVSDMVKAWVDQVVPGANTHAVPNGVSTTRIHPTREDPTQVVVTFVGTLKPWHGVEDLLVAAANRREDWTVRIIGDGPQRHALEAMAAALGIDVDFRGAVSPSQMMEHLAGTAIAIAPYPQVPAQESYFSPLKVYEYLAAGLPVVASNIGQIPQILEGLGTLVPASDPHALAAAIDALATEAQLRAELGARGRRRAVERHSWSGVVDRILDEAGGAS